MPDPNTSALGGILLGLTLNGCTAATSQFNAAPPKSSPAITIQPPSSALAQPEGDDPWDASRPVREKTIPRGPACTTSSECDAYETPCRTNALCRSEQCS